MPPATGAPRAELARSSSAYRVDRTLHITASNVVLRGVGRASVVGVDTRVETWTGENSAPEDFVEGRDEGATLWPPSLYEHQRARRLQSR